MFMPLFTECNMSGLCCAKKQAYDGSTLHKFVCSTSDILHVMMIVVKSCIESNEMFVYVDLLFIEKYGPFPAILRSAQTSPQII